MPAVQIERDHTGHDQADPDDFGQGQRFFEKPETDHRDHRGRHASRKATPDELRVPAEPRRPRRPPPGREAGKQTPVLDR